MKSIILFFINILARISILTPIRTAKLKFFYKLHNWPNFKHPKDINEKINWMKFYGDTTIWPLLADKYAVREYVKERVGEEALIPLIGKWDSVDDIDFDQLPDKFVMKCNNGCGDVVICQNKADLDIEKIKNHLKRSINEKLSSLSGEPHYAKIKPCIIAEELLDSSTQPCRSTSMVDYKIWVFAGKPMFIMCLWNREKFHANVALYDLDWNFHPEWSVWTSHYVMPQEHIPKPTCFEKLIEVAGKLGNELPVVRVDLYVVNNKIYFGEITLTSQGGYMDYFTKEFLDKMGKLTKLPVD